MIGRNPVQPGVEGPRGIVLVKLVANLHENFHGCVFRIFASRQCSPAKAENGRSVVPVKVTPGFRIPCPGPSDGLARLPCFRRVHPAWFLDVHRLIRLEARKTYTAGAAAERENAPLAANLAQHSIRRITRRSPGKAQPAEEKRLLTMGLEGEFGGDLQAPWSAATEERIADSYVAGNRQREKSAAPSESYLRSRRRMTSRTQGVGSRGDAVEIGIRQVTRIERAGEIRMVQEVVGLDPELELQALGDGGVLEDREIELVKTGTDERVSSFVAEMHG